MATLDLNQLRTLVVLYELRSLTATADFLHVTQPTVSYTLARLREKFGDDLFRREGHLMVPTARATQLFGPLHEALAQIESTVNDATGFDASTYTGELSLGLTSIGEQTFLPEIMRALSAENSTAHLVVKRLDSDNVEEELVRGTLDLAITVSLMDTSRLWRTPVREVEYVALSSGAHPLPPVGPDMFAGRGFIRVSARGGHVFPLQLLLEHGLMPQVALTIEEYGTLPAILQATELVALLPRHVAEVFCGWFPGLGIADLPWPGQSTPVAIFTRRESSLSPVQQWFRSVVFRAVAAISDPTDSS